MWLKKWDAIFRDHFPEKDDRSTVAIETRAPLLSFYSRNKSALLTNPATLAHSREKAKRWVREQATRFLESYFKVTLKKNIIIKFD